MYKDKFILSVIHDGHPVKETGPNYRREVAIPFGSEYRLRLKNKNDRACTARVFIDGKRVSQLGDFVIQAGSFLDLERFVDRSLSSGNRFKFVSLDHPSVDDPSSSENGLIEVEFRLAKLEPVIINWIVQPSSGWGQSTADWPYKEYGNGTVWRYYNDSVTANVSDNVSYSNDAGPVAKSSFYCQSSPLKSKGVRSLAEPGATVEGGHSNQDFHYTNLSVEDFPTAVLKLKIVGLRNSEEISRPNVKYCTRCGHSVETKDRYCAGCGRRL